MKKTTLPLFALAALLFNSCEEKPISIPALSVGKRNVLVEELTGVRCPNCPDGTAKLESLGELYGENLIVVSIHAALGYDDPYTESKYDFRTPEGTEMAHFIGTDIGYPTAGINRRLLPSKTSIFIFPETAWAGPIKDALAEPPSVGVFMETTFNAASRQLDIDINIAPDNTLTGEHRLTVLITQDSIQDYQKVGLTKVPDYYHRHVLRKILTLPTGDVISEPLTSTSTVNKKFSFTLPAEWKEKHCNVVAFVHRSGTPDKEVLQAVEEHVVK